MLQSTESQRVRHNLVTEQQQQSKDKLCFSPLCSNYAFLHSIQKIIACSMLMLKQSFTVEIIILVLNSSFTLVP